MKGSFNVGNGLTAYALSGQHFSQRRGGDGITDPQNIDDASLAAAQYLCADNRNLSSGDGWLRAILSYNDSLDYAQEVYGFAQSYARNAKGVI